MDIEGLTNEMVIDAMIIAEVARNVRPSEVASTNTRALVDAMRIRGRAETIVAVCNLIVEEMKNGES